MPLVRIEMLEGKTLEYKRETMASIHKALVEALRIPEQDQMQKLYELKTENFITVPDMTDDAIFIEISMFKGRSRECKKNLYQAIVKNLKHSPGISETDVFIVLHEEPLENWGIRGGKSAAEVNFNFDIEV